MQFCWDWFNYSKQHVPAVLWESNPITQKLKEKKKAGIFTRPFFTASSEMGNFSGIIRLLDAVAPKFLCDVDNQHQFFILIFHADIVASFGA